MANVKPIPEGYHSITPYLVLKNAARAIDFYKKAFGATERFRMEGPGGTVAHAELQIGDSMFMLGEECAERGYTGPEANKRPPIGLMIYVENVDKIAEQAQAAGAKVLQPVQDQFYGDRSGTFTDPFGHTWTVATHVEDVTKEEMERRMASLAQTA